MLCKKSKTNQNEIVRLIAKPYIFIGLKRIDVQSF